MEIFVLIKYILCDDNWNGHLPESYTDSIYVEDMNCVYTTFEEAKIEVDKMIGDDDDIVSYNAFVRIIKMTVGDKQKEIVYQSIDDDKLHWYVYNEWRKD